MLIAGYIDCIYVRRNETEESMKSILVTSFVILALFAGVVSAQENIEKKKIEFLISSVTPVLLTVEQI